MKKFLKIFLLSLVLLGGIALVVCYIVINEQTKAAIDVVMEYLNRPLPIAGLSTITIGGVLYFLIQHTSFGRRTVNELKGEFDELKNKCDKKISEAKSYKELADKTIENTKVILSGFSQEIDILTEELVKVCETSPNAKIKAIGEDIKTKASDIKSECEEKLATIDTDLKAYKEEKLNVKELENKVGELETLIKGMVEKYEEREETINNQAEEE